MNCGNEVVENRGGKKKRKGILAMELPKLEKRWERKNWFVAMKLPKMEEKKKGIVAMELPKIGGKKNCSVVKIVGEDKRKKN